MKYLNYSILLIAGFMSNLAIAQTPKKDTLSGQVVIEKQYQPYLEDGKKQTFQPIMPKVKPSSKENLTYEVPSEFIQSSYDLDDIKPLPIDIKLTTERKNYYLKGGYGSMNNPLVQLAISGAKENNFTAGILGNYSALTGSEYDDQKMMDAQMQVFGTKTLPNASANANIHYKHDGDYLYGYDHSLAVNEDDIKQAFHQAGGRIGLESTNNYDYSWNYNADISFDITTDDLYDLSESKAKLSGEVSKNINEFVDIAILGRAITRQSKFEYNTKDKLSDQVFSATPMVTTSIVEDLDIEAGASLNVDDENGFKIFPHISLQYPILGNQYQLFAGYRGSIENFGIQELKELNTRVSSSVRPHNYVKQTITPIGIKGALNSNLSFNLFVDHTIQENTQLFSLEDSGLSNTFLLLEEEKLTSTTPQLEFNAKLNKRLNAIAELSYHIYNTETLNDAYQLPKFSTDLLVEFKPIERLTLRSGTEVYSGIETFSGEQLDTIFDLDLEAEFSLNDNINFFIQGNNLANQNYEYWQNYEVAGINVLGGVVLAF